MKISKIFILSVMLITMLSVFVSATTYESFALQGFLNSDDTSSLRTVESNGLDSTDDLSACSVGYGSELGVYPVVAWSSDFLTKFSFLVVPTTSGIRVINSACGEINVVSLSGVTFYGTMSTISENAGTPEKYIMFGYNATSDEYGFYAFSFDQTSKTILYDSQKMIGEYIDIDLYNGAACGWKQRNIPDNGMCAVAYDRVIYIWDIETDSIIIENTTQIVDRFSPELLPYGSCVDFDNDGNNEFVFGGVTLSGYSYVSYDLYSETLDKDVIKSNTAYAGFIYSGAGLNPINEDVIPVMPCQIGGASSEFEICINYIYLSGASAHDPISVSQVLEQDGTYHTYISAADHINSEHLFKMNTGLFSSGTANKQMTIPKITTYAGSTSVIDLTFYESDYTTELNSITIDATSFGRYIGTLMFDITGNGTKELILSTGDIYDYDNSSLIPYKLPYLTDTSTGYLVAGDLNGDYENEVIYSDANNIYIYSTNPTTDYEIVVADYYCTWTTPSTASVCSALQDGYYAGTNDCTALDIIDCINDIAPEPVIETITGDTDGGLNYILNGIAFVTDNGVNGTTGQDYCFDNATLNEYYISSGVVSSSVIGCTALSYFGCINGECVNESDYNFTQEGILNGSIDIIIGGITTQEIPEIEEEEEEINFVLDSLNDNLKLIFALFMIAGIVILTSKQTKSPMVLVFVGIITTVLMSYLGMIPSVVLIILLITLVVLMLLGFALGMGRGSNE